MGNPESDNSPYTAGPPAAGEDTISLLDLVAVLAKRKWLIIGVTAAGAVAILVLLILSMRLAVTSPLNFFPDKYKPTAAILLQSPSQTSSVSSLLNSSGLSSLSGLFGGATSLGGTSADLVTALLRTNSILDQVAKEFDLATRFHFAKNPKTSARTYLTSGIRTKTDAASGMMQIGFEDTDKELATKIVNRLVDLVGNEFTMLSVSKILDKEKYLSDQLDAAQTAATRLQTNLLAFQSKNGIYSVSEQTTANIQTVAALQGKIIDMQILLNSQRKYFPENDYRNTQLEDQIKETQDEIAALTKGVGTSITGAVSQNQLVSLAARYQNLVRDLSVQQAIVSTLKSQYEAARIDELSKQQAFQVVDTAEVPEVRSAPQRTKTAAIVTLVALFVSILLAFVVEYVDRARRDPREAGKLQAIRRSFTVQRRHRSSQPPPPFEY